MAYTLSHNSYGKSAVRLTKVVRDGDVHHLYEFDVAVQLEGDFSAAYLHGDNRSVVATDTIKNTVYVIAKRSTFDSVEQFATILANHFVDIYSHVSSAKVEVDQKSWRRITFAGRAHDHAFTSDGTHTRRALATLQRGGAVQIQGGFKGLEVLKTTASAWRDFHSDEYRTLKDTSDRILATSIDAVWTFTAKAADFNRAYDQISEAMLKTFATTHSLGAQQTIYDMGNAALEACEQISKIEFTLPNQHRIPFNLNPFGLKFENDIFVATDEPYGLIHGTVTR